MTTPSTPLSSYVLQVADVQQQVAAQMGVDLRYATLNDRVWALVSDLTVCAVIKILVDTGVLSQALLSQVLAQAAAADYSAQPLWVVPPPDGSDPPPPTGF